MKPSPRSWASTLVRDEEVLQYIAEMFSSRGRAMPENNGRQADVPVGATLIAQVTGTAPGLICPVGHKVIYALPGVPYELVEMTTARAVLPDLRARLAAAGEQAAIVEPGGPYVGNERVGSRRGPRSRVSRRSTPTAVTPPSHCWRVAWKGSRYALPPRPPTPTPAAALVEAEAAAGARRAGRGRLRHRRRDHGVRRCRRCCGPEGSRSGWPSRSPGVWWRPDS